MKVKIFALAAGLFAASGVAGYADTVSESNSYGPADTFWDAFIGLTGFNATLARNHLAGNLTGVSIYVREDVSGEIQNYNSADNSSTVTSNLLNSWGVLLPDTYTLNDALMVTNQEGSKSNVVSENLGATSYGVLNQVSGYSEGLLSSVLGDNLSPYLGAFLLEAYDIGGLTTNVDNGNGDIYFHDMRAISIEVTYTYDPVSTPEPATLALLGSSLFGLGLVRRRLY